MAALHLLRPLFPRSPCPGCRQLSRTARRLEEPASRPKVRSMPTAKRVEPEKGAFESLEAAPAKMATEGVQEADVAEVIYRCTPKRSPAFYYVTIVFLVGVGVNVAEAWRLDSMGTLTRPLLPTEEKIKANENKRYPIGGAAILGATLFVGGFLAYLPTRRISTLTIIPRFPKPEAVDQRIAWYHHADCIIHGNADFIRLPFRNLAKGRRVPFAALRLVNPISNRPLSAATAGAGEHWRKRVGKAAKVDPRFASLRVCTDYLDTPIVHYTMEKPGVASDTGTTECEDALVLERALEFNARVEEEWKREMQGKGRVM